MRSARRRVEGTGIKGLLPKTDDSVGVNILQKKSDSLGRMIHRDPQLRRILTASGRRRSRGRQEGLVAALATNVANRTPPVLPSRRSSELCRVDGIGGDQIVAFVGGKIVVVSAVLNLVGIGSDAHNTNTSGGLIGMGIRGRTSHGYWDYIRIIVVIIVIHVIPRLRSRTSGRTSDHTKP